MRARGAMIVRDENGFTLAEMLVSLVIFSLSMAVIWQGAGLVSRLNQRVQSQKIETARIQGIAAELDRRLSPLQPITDSQLTGQATHMMFQCDRDVATQNCTYDLPFGHLVYIADGAHYSDWPPVKAEGVPAPARLAAVELENDQGKSLAVIKFPVEHAANCQFDMISRTCRTESAVSEATP